LLRFFRPALLYQQVGQPKASTSPAAAPGAQFLYGLLHIAPQDGQQDGGLHVRVGPGGAVTVRPRSSTPDDCAAPPPSPPAGPRPAAGRRPPGESRWVNAHGKISLAGFSYHVGATYAGEPVEVVVAGGLVEILHAEVVIATHAQRMREDQADRAPRAPVARRARDATAGLTVTRLANRAGVVSFAGTDYQAGRGWARQSVDVSIAAGSVQLSRDGKVIRVHPIRHDRARELGAFANPKGRPRRKNSAAGTVA
jgi:hypothetical protein